MHEIIFNKQIEIRDREIETLKKINMELAIACKEVLRRFKIVTGGDEKAAFDANLIISKIERVLI